MQFVQFTTHALLLCSCTSHYITHIIHTASDIWRPNSWSPFRIETISLSPVVPLTLTFLLSQSDSLCGNSMPLCVFALAGIVNTHTLTSLQCLVNKSCKQFSLHSNPLNTFICLSHFLKRLFLKRELYNMLIWSLFKCSLVVQPFLDNHSVTCKKCLPWWILLCLVQNILRMTHKWPKYFYVLCSIIECSETTKSVLYLHCILYAIVLTLQGRHSLRQSQMTWWRVSVSRTWSRCLEVAPDRPWMASASASLRARLLPYWATTELGRPPPCMSRRCCTCKHNHTATRWMLNM